MPAVGQFPPWCLQPMGYDDPLLPAVTRFVAARPGLIGSGALARRFGIGRLRAARLLVVLHVTRVCLGYRPRGLWRVEHSVWRALHGGAV